MGKTCFVMLGNRCNQNCSYCYQDKTLSEFVFDERIIKTVDNSERVMFYGGEPLLYLDIIEYIVKRLTPKRFINITTNGTLLTDGVVDFVNKHKIHISLSHDGAKHCELRGYDDPLRTHGDLFEAIKNKALICVVNNINYNYYDLWEYLRINKLDTKHTFQHVKYCGVTDQRFLFNNNHAWEQLLGEISERVIVDITKRRMSNELLFFRKFLYDKLDFCSCQNNYICIDLAGKEYACHNYKQSRMSRNPFCNINCEAKAICGGGCLCEPNKYDCYLYKTIYRYREKILNNTRR